MGLIQQARKGSAITRPKEGLMQIAKREGIKVKMHKHKCHRK
jgi:hypothetical protein